MVRFIMKGSTIFMSLSVLVIFRARVGAAVKSTAIALTNWLKSQEYGIKT
jgi:hypothetical protein